MSRGCLCIVLAAGEGTRMRSSLPKVLHEIANLPMICHVINTLAQIEAEKVLVVLGNQADLVRAVVDDFVQEHHEHLQVDYVVQRERLGTAHAVLACREELAKSYEKVLVVFGDTPLIEATSLSKAISLLSQGSDIGIFGFIVDNPYGYGRLIEADGQLIEIVEEKDATIEQKQIKFCNGGLMVLRGAKVLELLEEIDCKNSSGEFYLTDIIKIANRKKLLVRSITVPFDNVLGVNSAEQLAAADDIWQQRKRAQFLSNGVILQMPQSIYFSYNTCLEPGVRVEPNVYFGPNVSVASNAHIQAFSYLEGTNIAKGAKIGPFARLRNGSEIGAEAKIGNFCEVKNSHIGTAAKINHLSYIGDTEIGARSNIGAGTITCNYDGISKWKTKIASDVFVGSNSSLVAPIEIKSGAYIASGSVITEDVPNDALAIARSRQINKIDYAREIRVRNSKIDKQEV